MMMLNPNLKVGENEIKTFEVKSTEFRDGIDLMLFNHH